MDDLISRQELLKRTIYNPLHGPYIIAQDVLDCPSARQWIPCSERLPDKEGEYLVTFSDEWNRNLVRALWYGTPFDLDDRTMWTFYCEHEYGFEAFKAEKPIVAWMPLPEPYKESEGCVNFATT